MIVLALNCGSSSLKYMLFNVEEHELTCKGAVERIGEKEGVIVHQLSCGTKTETPAIIKDHKEGLGAIIDFISNPKNNILKNVNDISAVGHRLVHGGEKFASSVLLTDEVLETVRDMSDLAPLHNPANIMGIEAAEEVLPDVPHIAVFDTAFHQSIPDYAYTYATPYEWYSKHRVRRYGFHGSSHLYVSKRAAVMLGKKPSETNCITLHIGNGVSHAAIKNGRSIDTSMGFTPLEGAVMGTRCGDMDPAIIPFIMEKEGLTAKEVDSILNKKSGILGITGHFSDRRDVEQAADKGDKRCQLAEAIEAYRIKKYIGAYSAVLGTVHAIAFTAGVGENSPKLRERACSELDCLGIKIDKDINRKTHGNSGETEISTPDSKIKVFMIPTNEEIVMIEDIKAILEDRYQSHMDMDYCFLK